MSTTLLLALLALLTQLQDHRTQAPPQRVPVQAHGVMAPTMPLALQRVAYCESRNRHYDQHGKVLRGRGNRHAIGTYQIHRLVHAQRATQLGYNLWRPQGNAGYALWLYRAQGLAPWDATSPVPKATRASRLHADNVPARARGTRERRWPTWTCRSRRTKMSGGNGFAEGGPD